LEGPPAVKIEEIESVKLRAAVATMEREPSA
jgi:hypothetical protein